mgnify:CR=1 FL=1
MKTEREKKGAEHFEEEKTADKTAVAIAYTPGAEDPGERQGASRGENY